MASTPEIAGQAQRPRLRHVKTEMRHLFMLDDGDTLVEYTGEAVVTARQWQDFVNGGFDRAMGEIEAKLLEGRDAADA